MASPGYHAYQSYKRSRLGGYALALACLLLAQLLGLVHQTQHAPQIAAASATHLTAQHAHDEHGLADVLGHEQGGVVCQLVDAAAASPPLLIAVVVTAALVAVFACPLAVGTVKLANTMFALYCARAPPARLA